MSFLLEALRDKPVGLFNLDDTTPLQDYSGYNRTATTTGGTPVNHAALCSGSKYSQVMTPTISASFASPVFLQGKESDSFSLEVWLKVTASGARQQVLSNTGQMDGIVVEGNKVSFITRHANAADAAVTFDIQQGRAIHVVGTHTKDKNSLFVNGVLVGEITLTEAQQAGSYPAPGGTLNSGGGAGATQSFALGPVGIYATALPQETILRHYQMGVLLPDEDDVATGFDGVVIPLSLSNANIFLDQWWTTDEDWKAASLFNVSVVDGRLVPQFDEVTSLPGRWLDSFALDAAEGTSIQGVSFNWDGIGVTIEVSLDGTTWETVQRGKNIGLIAPGFNPTAKELQIRVSFAGGIVNDSSYLDNLNAVGLKTSSSPAVHGRTVTYNNAYPERDYPPLQFHDNWGVEIGAGGSVIISADAAESRPVRTIEVWMKPTTDSTVTFGGAVTSTYVNGVSAGSSVMRGGEWVLVHRVLSADNAGNITFNNPGQVGHVAFYDRALTAAESAAIYAAYTNSSSTRINDTNGLSLTHPVPATKLYLHDWSIQSSG